jgi:hypothetical protein
MAINQGPWPYGVSGGNHRGDFGPHPFLPPLLDLEILLDIAGQQLGPVSQVLIALVLVADFDQLAGGPLLVAQRASGRVIDDERRHSKCDDQE